MIVDNKGLRYVDGYKECIIHSDANVPTLSGSFNYQWKIPYENNSICTIFNSCILDYHINITSSFNTTNNYILSESGVELKLNQIYTTESFDDVLGLAYISFKLTKNDSDGNFIIEISSNGQNSTINMMIATVDIKYQSKLYDLQVKNNQINIGKDLSVGGDVSIGGDVSMGGDLTTTMITCTGAEMEGSLNVQQDASIGGSLTVEELKGSEIKITPTIKCVKKITRASGDPTREFEKDCIAFTESYSPDFSPTYSYEFGFFRKGTSMATPINGYVNFYIFLEFEDVQSIG